MRPPGFAVVTDGASVAVPGYLTLPEGRSMITVSNVTKGFGGRTLFDNVEVAFKPGHNYGLTGPNGAGKSTLMKIFIGLEEPDRGTISRPKRTGYLRQDHHTFDDFRVIDVVIMGNKRLWEAMQAKEEIYQRAEFTDADNEALGELECVVGEEDGYAAESEAARLLDGIGVPQAMHDQKMAMLQGGLKVRALVAQALFGKPDALLLDEPTNHLDMESIEWLEEFLLAYDGVLIVISHDRRFLNAVCTDIADIDYETVITYPGNYDEMVRMKSQIRGRLDKDAAAKEKKIAQLTDFIQRFGAGTRASQTRSRAKQIEKLRPEEVKRSNIARPFIRFPVTNKSGKDVLTVKGLTKAYDRPIFTNVSTLVQRGDKIVVIGRNGVGKTTLLETLVGDKKPDAGTIQWGHETSVGFFRQEHRHEVEPGRTVFDWLFQHRPAVGQEHVRGILGRMLFSGADGAKPTSTLSGGECARLVMCRLMLLEHNVLLLDEPTAHLDLESISSLREALEAYEGTLIYVTHDRDLASAATRVWAYTGENQFVDYAGNIDEFLDWQHKQAKKAS
jgi:ATPase subunit of ABC transporter with duplicated ATPase domains